jgi:hypothetical protein
MSYNCQNLAELLNQEFWTDRTLWYTSGSRRNFTMTTLETLETHMALSNARFGSYELLKSGHGAERFWTDWT